MARQRYESDEKRIKRPAGAVVATSILNPSPEHPEQSEVFDDPELRGIWTGLLVLAVQAFAGRTEDRVTLSRGQVAWLTGRSWRSIFGFWDPGNPDFRCSQVGWCNAGDRFYPLCGAYNGDFESGILLWREAGNRVQWRAPRAD